MILLHGLKGPPLALNADLIERVEATPDTVLTMVDGSRHVVAESLDAAMSRIRESQASAIAMTRMNRFDPPEHAVIMRLVRDDDQES
jgi:flagellar protein FlbD